MHSFHTFYPIWINLVPKYCSNLMYYEHFSKKDFYDILGSVMGSKMIKKTPNSGKNVWGGGGLSP